MSNLRKIDPLLGIGLCVLALIGLFIIIPAGVDLPQDIEVAALSPSFWPTIVISVIGLVGVVIAIEGWAKTEDPESTSDQDDWVAQAKRFALIIIILLGIYLATPFAGMVASCTIGIIFICLMGGEQRPLMIAGLGLGLPLLLYGFFVYVANVPLPVGTFFEMF